MIFDLDGTLVDSRVDLAASTNMMLADLGLPGLAQEQIISYVGEGIAKLVQRSLSAVTFGDIPSEMIERATMIFREHYQSRLTECTSVYPGVLTFLDHFSSLPMGVVTNKPYDATMPILQGLQLAGYFKSVIGGDSQPERKPSPMPLIRTAEICNVSPASCMMIGDTHIDIIAGRAAGMKTAGFAGGFRGRPELESAGADLIFDRYDQLDSILNS